MKLKYLIFIGIVLLITGLIIRIEGTYAVLGVCIMLLGTASKLSYIIASIIKKTYRPSLEMLLLYTGIMVFFTGLYFRRHGFTMGIPLEVTGIIMKLTFVILFIKKLRASRA